jgi:hypothetical protein
MVIEHDSLGSYLHESIHSSQFLSIALSFNLQAQEKKIVVVNQYWAKNGKIQEVYQHRLYASEVRRELGLAVGRVLFNADTTDESSPHVVWECEYPSIEARKQDIQLLRESGKFDAVTEKMGTLIDNFQRTIYETEIVE